MALEYKVKKYKAKEKFTFIYEENSKTEKEIIDILVTFEEAEEIIQMVEGKMTLERFAEILFKDKLAFIKEKAGLDYEDCVIAVGFQFTTKVFKDKVKLIKSTSSMQDFLKTK